MYTISLSFLIERAIFFLDSKTKPAELEIIVEKRGKVEDNELLRHYNEVHSVGTGFVTPARIKGYNTRLRFKAKKENINGLQPADLIAHPIARCAECKDEVTCGVRDVMKDARDATLNVLANTSLEDIVERESKLINTGKGFI